MRFSAALQLGLAVTLLTASALPCGGGFGQGLTIQPSQTIVLAHRDGVETYVFGPHFCGAASDFGLILPVPSTLTEDPALGGTTLTTELEAISAPAIVTEEVCVDADDDDSYGSGMAPGAAPDDGVMVIKSGQVGIFQWELLKADSAQSFTDWLTANQFPTRSSAQSAFDYYVQAGWYFVAFRITASASAPPQGYRVCGDLGPIQLSFATPQAVVPARIASADGPETKVQWRIYTISAHRLATLTPGVSATTRFAGTLSADVLATSPSVATLATTDEWLTKTDVVFYPADQGSKGVITTNPLSQDIAFDPATSDAAYRETQVNYSYVHCGCGCRVARGWARSRTALGVLVGLMSVAAAIAVRRRARG
jgi:hypothetical protein